MAADTHPESAGAPLSRQPSRDHCFQVVVMSFDQQQLGPLKKDLSLCLPRSTGQGVTWSHLVSRRKQSAEIWELRLPQTLPTPQPTLIGYHRRCCYLSVGDLLVLGQPWATQGLPPL